jgi:propanol-preferring alcohol dehydrogenase
MGCYFRNRRIGHVAVQYAKAMGMHVAAIDVADDKLDLPKKLGADLGS